MNIKDLSSAELELTQRIQLLFPRGLRKEVLQYWNGAKGAEITEALRKAFDDSTREFRLNCKENVGRTQMVSFSAREYFIEGKYGIAGVSHTFTIFFGAIVVPDRYGYPIRYGKLPYGLSSQKLSELLSVTAPLDLPGIHDQLSSYVLTKEEGKENVFFAYDINSELRSISVVWTEQGWQIDASALSKREIPAGSHVFALYCG